MSMDAIVTIKMTNGNSGMRCFEDILLQSGWGLYNKFVLFFSFLCAFCTSAAITTNTFALPVAICDIQLTKDEVMWINAVSPLGMSVGVLTFALLSDIASRRFILPCSLIIIFICTFACGFCYEFTMIFITTFFLGMSVSANFAFVKVNLCEILPMKSRGYYLVLVDLFWVFGYIVSSSINWAMRCKISKDYSEHYTSWRMLYGFAPVICTLCICVHGIIQPSPRLLLSTNRKLEAYLVLKYIFSINNSDHSDNLKVPLTAIDHLITEIRLDRDYLNNCREQCILARYKIRKVITKLSQKKLFYTIFLVTIIKSSLFTGFTMANVWLVKSLHMDVFKCNLNMTNISYLHNEDLCSYFIPTTIFRDFILIASSAFVALLLFSFMVDKLGRCIPLSVVLIVCGVASFNFIFIKEFHYRYILAVSYMAGFAIANSILDLVVIENLPTCARSTGLAITLFFPYVEAFFFGLFYKSECSIFYYTIGAITVAVGVVGYFLPERKRKPMQE